MNGMTRRRAAASAASLMLSILLISLSAGGNSNQKAEEQAEEVAVNFVKLAYRTEGRPGYSSVNIYLQNHHKSRAIKATIRFDSSMGSSSKSFTVEPQAEVFVTSKVNTPQHSQTVSIAGARFVS